MQTWPVILAQQQTSGGPLGLIVMVGFMIAIFYFMLIRPQQRKEKERQKMISELRAGQRVLFAGGLLGNIVEAKSYTFIIEVASGVRMEVARGAVSRVLKDGETTALDQPQNAA